MLRVCHCLLHPCSHACLCCQLAVNQSDVVCVLASPLLLFGVLLQLPHEVDDLVMAQEEGLRGAATQVAARLRAAGRRVDLVLEDGKRLKWAFKQAERCGAGEEAPDKLCLRDALLGEGGHQRPHRIEPPTALSPLPITHPHTHPPTRTVHCLALQLGWCWWRGTSGRAARCGSRTWRHGRRRTCCWMSWSDMTPTC